MAKAHGRTTPKKGPTGSSSKVSGPTRTSGSKLERAPKIAAKRGPIAQAAVAPRTAKLSAKAIQVAPESRVKARPAKSRARPRAGQAHASPRSEIASLLPAGGELDGDAGPGASDEVARRWVRRGEELLRALADHGCAEYEYRADLREGRIVWLTPSGSVSAEARAQVLCSWSPTTNAIAMGWIDPLVRAASVARIEGLPPERDRVDEEAAWRIAMYVAEASGADFLHRIPTPHAWYFMALRDLSFAPKEPSFAPGTPVGLVMRGLTETRRAVASRAEPSEVVRERLCHMGTALLEQARYAYRDTDWVARLERTGRRLGVLAKRVACPGYQSVAAGCPAFEWVQEELAKDLVAALALLEDEWGAFA